MIVRVWKKFWGPAGAVSLGTLLCIGFFAGIIFWGGFNTAVEASNELEFCISCHEMRDTPYQEYKESVHYKNASGVGAICSDCHVPKKWFPKVVRKIKASRELFGHFITGVVDTPEKFKAHRAEMAKKVWATMKKNDSLECRNCHHEDHMDFSLQSEDAQEKMQEGFEKGETCIDCHKGIAHELPDLSEGYRKMFEEIEEHAKTIDPQAAELYTIKTTKYYGAANDASAEENAIGQILAATHLTVLERKGGAIKVQIDGWQQDGVGQVIYALRGHRIFEATVKKSALEQVQIYSTETDVDTELVWHKASMQGWIMPGEVIEDVEPLWQYAAEMYSASCGICHSKPAPSHSLANQWIGSLKAMKRFITLDKEEYRLLQKYLQLNAKDTGAAEKHEKG